MDLGFTDEEGKPVTLKELFSTAAAGDPDQNYSNCPMLCSLQLTALVLVEEVDLDDRQRLPNR